jgi:hypothetical protein
MSVTKDHCGHILVLLFTFLLFCIADNHAQPIPHVTSVPTDVKVAGTWDAHFSGKVEGKGTPHDDNFVMTLKQDGSKVTGTLRFEGLNLTFPVSGNVTGTAFVYTSKAKLGPDCEAKLAGETIVEAASGSLRGSQTQTSCEGTAIGEVTAVRR